MTIDHSLVEVLTGGLRVISTDHALIHLGWGFSFSHVVVNVAAGASLYVQFITPDTRAIHFKSYEAWSGASRAMFNMYESAVFTNGTTPVACRNRNRMSSNVCGVSLASDPSAINLTNAILLEQAECGGGGGGSNTVAGRRSIDVEWVFKKSTKYLFQIVNNDAQAKDCALWAFWYEEDDYA